MKNRHGGTELSLRLYLNSARRPRTPDGSAGEWAGFADGTTGIELEAENWPPLLWWALFGRADLREARIADTEDVGTVEHAELLSQWGDATYPYLVTDQSAALARLRARRPGLAGRLGARYGSVYEEFAALAEARFGPYVLLRTAALAGDDGVRPQFERTLADLERLDAGGAVADGGPVDGLIVDFHRWRQTDPVWLLSGAGVGDAWPSAALRERLAAGAGRRKSGRGGAWSRLLR
ncbi:hypothetical protein [Streptomyces laurentii]|uniref:hypothetical protein n=1 Tax=Streptomyces laurentii TaxID=39478 RepID=UPI0036C4FEF0